MPRKHRKNVGLIGLGIIGFYAGVLLTFDYGFQFNALFTALYLLPFEPWVTKRAERMLAQRS